MPGIASTVQNGVLSKDDEDFTSISAAQNARELKLPPKYVQRGTVLLEFLAGTSKIVLQSFQPHLPMRSANRVNKTRPGRRSPACCL